jgi:Flp pilus assembly protein TadG
MKKIIGNNGAALVEFALVLPLLLLILFGIIEFAVIFFNQQMITNASREGARFGIVSQTPRITEAQIRQRVKDYCLNNLITWASNTGTPSDADIDTTAKAAPVFPNDDLRVTVRWNYQFLILPGFVSAFFGGSANTGITLVATSLMKYE